MKALRANGIRPIVKKIFILTIIRILFLILITVKTVIGKATLFKTHQKGV